MMANDNPTSGRKGAPAAEQPADTEVTAGESQVAKVYEKASEGDSGREARDGYVVYRGVATHRKIYAGQWKRAGVDGQDDTEWTAENQYSVPLEQLSERAQDLLRQDGQFLFPKS